MPYTATHDPVLNIVEVTFTGLMVEKDLREATSECIHVQKQTGTTRFLVDLNEADVRASFLAIRDLANTQYWEEGALRETFVAVIRPMSERGREAVRFYETVCHNRGWIAKVYSDRQNAVDWLRRTTSTPGPD
jgi:hypothetical protein